MNDDTPAGRTGADADRRLAIDAPDASPNDESIAVRVTGVDPGETVELAASLTDSEGRTWSSRATFTAGADGVVDVTDQAPEAGSYEGVEPMGWLWSMTTDADAPFATFANRSRVTVDLRASTGDDRERAERTITRRLYDDGITAHEVDRDGLAGTLYVPSGDGPHPGVLELHGSGGRRSDGTARLLATRGFATLALEYFGDADALPDELERIPLSYFDDAATWLRDRPGVAGDRVGLVGASRGAELALLLGARRDWVGAVVSYAGSVPWNTPSGAPAWLDDGDPIPHVVADEHPAETDLDEKPVAEAVPAVENTDGPILLLSGGEDSVWPARELSELVVDRLDDHGFPHDYDHRSYDDVGHLVGTPYAPLSGIDDSDRVGGTARGTAYAAEDSWPVVLDTLNRGLENGE